MIPINGNGLTIYTAKLVKKNKTIATVFKKFNLYDSFTFVTFFFSEIEKLWLISVKNGSVRINGTDVRSNKILNNQSRIEIGDIEFNFTNLCNGIGLSQKIIENFFIQNEEKLKISDILNYTEELQNKKFILEYLNKNELFYRVNDLWKINYRKYIELLEKQTDPLIKSMLYEMETTKCSSESFNVKKLWNNIMFTGKGIINNGKDEKCINQEISLVSWPYNRTMSLNNGDGGEKNDEKEKTSGEENNKGYEDDGMMDEREKMNGMQNNQNKIEGSLNKLEKMVEFYDSRETKSNEVESKYTKLNKKMMKNKKKKEEIMKNNKLLNADILYNDELKQKNKINKINKKKDNYKIISMEKNESIKNNESDRETDSRGTNLINMNKRKDESYREINGYCLVDNMSKKKREDEMKLFIEECTEFMNQFKESYKNKFEHINESLENIDYIERFNKSTKNNFQNIKESGEKKECMNKYNYCNCENYNDFRNKLKRENSNMTEDENVLLEIENNKDCRFMGLNEHKNEDEMSLNGHEMSLNEDEIDLNGYEMSLNGHEIDLNGHEYYNEDDRNKISESDYKDYKHNKIKLNKIITGDNGNNKFNKIEVSQGFLTKIQEDCIKSHNDSNKCFFYKSFQKMKSLKLKSNSFANIFDHVKVQKNDYYTGVEDYGKLKNNFELFFNYKTIESEAECKVRMKEWLYKDYNNNFEINSDNKSYKSMNCILNKKDFSKNIDLNIEMLNDCFNKNSLINQGIKSHNDCFKNRNSSINQGIISHNDCLKNRNSSINQGTKSYNETSNEENTCHSCRFIEKTSVKNKIKSKPKKRKAIIVSNKKLKISFNLQISPVVHIRPSFNLMGSPSVIEYNNTLDYFKERLMNLKRSKSATDLGQHQKIQFEDKQISESKCRKNKRKREQIFGFFDL